MQHHPHARNITQALFDTRTPRVAPLRTPAQNSSSPPRSTSPPRPSPAPISTSPPTSSSSKSYSYSSAASGPSSVPPPEDACADTWPPRAPAPAPGPAPAAPMERVDGCGEGDVGERGGVVPAGGDMELEDLESGERACGRCVEPPLRSGTGPCPAPPAPMPVLCDARLEPGALAFGCGWPCMGEGGVDGRREPGWLPAADPVPDPDPEAALDPPPGLLPGPAAPIPLLDEVCLEGGVAGLAPDARGDARPEAGPPAADPDALGRWLLGPPDMLGRWLGPPEVLGRWLDPPVALGRWEVALGPPETLGRWLAAPEVLCRWLATPPAWLDRLLEGPAPAPVVLLRAVEGGCGWAGGCRRVGGELGLLSESTRPLPLALCRGPLSGEGEALAPLVVSPSMRPRREGAAGFVAPGRDGGGEAKPTRAVPGGLACPGRGLAGGAGPPGRIRAGPGDAGRACGPPGTADLGLAPAALRGEGGAGPAAEWGR